MDISSSISDSIEEFLEQRGTDHPAPRMRAGWAAIHHRGELLGKALNVCRRVYESHSLRSGAAEGKDVKSIFSAQLLIPALWNCF